MAWTDFSLRPGADAFKYVCGFVMIEPAMFRVKMKMLCRGCSHGVCSVLRARTVPGAGFALAMLVIAAAGVGAPARAQDLPPPPAFDELEDAQELEAPAESGQEGGLFSPGMSLPVGEMPTTEGADFQLEKTPEEIEAEIRSEAFDAAITGLFPMTPDEIRKTLETYHDTMRAAEEPYLDPPEARIGTTTISLDPGHKPPVLKLSVGHVTTLNILDITGQPWPIEDFGWAGDFEIVEPRKGSHIIRITPMRDYAYGNVSMLLVGLDTPLTMTLETSREDVFYRLDMRVPEYGPSASPPLIDRGITAVAGNTTIASILDGVPPGSAKMLKVSGADGRTTAYEVGGQTYVRTPLTLLSPGWSHSVRSANGMNVYELGPTPVLLLSDRGRMVRARLKPGTTR